MPVPFHDPLIVPISDGFLGLSTDLAVKGVQARRSSDLLTWSEPFPLLSEVPLSIARHVGTDRFWAPELVQRGACWRLYVCASRFGTTQSVIGLAQASQVDGEYRYVGDVLSTNHSNRFTQPNAIDSCVIQDRNGVDHLIYGSFFGGIHVLKLNEDGFPAAYDEGQLLAGGGHRAIEGAYAFYHKPSDRYILLVSFGDLHVDYHIRVGYSRELTGPYVDSQGFPLTDADPVHIPGDKLCGGYHFEGESGVMATGHCSLMQHEDAVYLVHHARPEGDVKHPFLQIRRLLFAPDGRALAWPLCYDGQPLTHVDTLPTVWQMVHHSRPNAGVIYSRRITSAEADAHQEGDTLTMTVGGRTWSGYLYQQGARVACTLLSPDGESLWGIAQEELS